MNKLGLLVILDEDEKFKIQKNRKKGNHNRKTLWNAKAMISIFSIIEVLLYSSCLSWRTTVTFLNYK